MFTGIIEVKSKIKAHDVCDEILTISIEKPDELDLKNGQSISVNGTCLTVVDFGGDIFKVELMKETLSKTIFGINIPKTVNLERAMLPSDRFEGHIVQGHIDGTGEVVAVKKESDTTKLTITYNSEFERLIVSKGSITVDGVSLTVVDVKEGEFSVSLIPYTLSNTTLSSIDERDMVNLEFDIVGKYITKNK